MHEQFINSLREEIKKHLETGHLEEKTFGRMLDYYHVLLTYKEKAAETKEEDQVVKETSVFDMALLTTVLVINVFCMIAMTK